MASRTRDALLGVGSGAALVAVLTVSGSLDALLDPRTAALGVSVGVVVEAAFVADTPVAAWWERPGIPALSALGLVGSAGAAVAFVGPAAVAAACWGLATYFGALALVESGHWPGDHGSGDRSNDP